MTEVTSSLGYEARMEQLIDSANDSEPRENPNPRNGMTKVKSVTCTNPNRPWKDNYFQLVECEDGNTYNAMSTKPEPPYKAGDEVIVELKGKKDRDGYDMAKIRKADAGGGSGGWKPSGKGGGSSSDSDGQRRGNAIHNATLIAIEKLKLDPAKFPKPSSLVNLVESLAQGIYRASGRLSDKPMAPIGSPQPEETQPAPISEEEPF